MKLATNWKDYELIKTSRGQKLERWNNIYLLRPDPNESVQEVQDVEDQKE